MFLGIRSLVLGTRLFARPIARPCSVFYICKPVRGPSDHVKRMMATDSGKDNPVDDHSPLQETHDQLQEGSNVESKNPVAPDQHELSKSVPEKDGLDSGDRDTQDQEDVKVTNEGKETDDKMDDSKVPTPPSEPTAPSTVDANSDSGPMDTSSGVSAEKDEEEATVPALKKALTETVVAEGSKSDVQTGHVPDLKKTQTEKVIGPHQSQFADLVKTQQREASSMSLCMISVLFSACGLHDELPVYQRVWVLASDRVQSGFSWGSCRGNSPEFLISLFLEPRCAAQGEG